MGFVPFIEIGKHRITCNPGHILCNAVFTLIIILLDLFNLILLMMIHKKSSLSLGTK